MLSSGLEPREEYELASFVSAIGDAARGAACDVLGVAENFNRFFNQPGGIASDNGQSAGYLAAVRRQLCNQNPPPDIPVDIPAAQCSGVEYNILWEYEQLSGTGDEWILVTGEFTGCNGEVGGPVSFRRRVDGDFYVYEWSYIRLSNGQPRTRSFSLNRATRIRNFDYRYQRCDGQPPTLPCDGVPEAPVGDWNVRGPINVTYDVGPDEFNLDVVFTVDGLEFNVNGELVLNVNANYIDADLNIPVDLDLNIPIDLGGFEFNFGGNRDEQPEPEPDCPPNPRPGDEVPEDPPPTSEDPGQTGEEEPPDLEQPPIRAALVTVTSLDLNRQVGTIQQGDNPDILIPAAGYISFQVAVGSSSGWTADIPVKNIRNFIPCPWDGGAIAVKGTPRPGVVWTITPIRTTLDED